MEDKQELTIEKYGFHVKNRYRARGAVILDTSEGTCLMRQYEKITGHFMFENELKNHLLNQGMVLTDRVVPNLEGELVTEWETGEKYVVYQWYNGDSCDYQKKRDLELAARNLGCLHRNLKKFEAMKMPPAGKSESLAARYERYNREMKRVYQYMKQKKRKSDFELQAMSCFREFFEKAEEAGRKLDSEEFVKVFQLGKADVCHGAYNYHNMIFSTEGIATTNFENAEYGTQIMDLAYFLRKVLEKSGWQIERGKIILDSYTAEITLSSKEWDFLKTVLSYPVKYRKLMNQYMNGKKTWISDKNMEKLLAVRQMESAKENFLRNMT